MVSAAEDTGTFDLQGAIKSLTSERAQQSLDPYQKRMQPMDRARAFKQLVFHRGRRYIGSSFDSFEIKGSEMGLVVSRLRGLSEDMPSSLSEGKAGLVLLGPPGTGKDHLLMALMRDAIVDHGFKVTWRDGLRLFAEIKAAIATNSTEELLKSMSSVQILAISDPVPPKDELTAYEMSILRDIVERRYSSMMATWITTNVQSAEDAVKLFSSAVLGRLLDAANEMFCNWENYRKPLRSET